MDKLIDYINNIIDKKGVSFLTEKNLKNSVYYKQLKEENLNNIDLDEFCCILADRYDDYISYISICND